MKLKFLRRKIGSKLSFSATTRGKKAHSLVTSSNLVKFLEQGAFSRCVLWHYLWLPVLLAVLFLTNISAPLEKWEFPLWYGFQGQSSSAFSLVFALVKKKTQLARQHFFMTRHVLKCSRQCSRHCAEHRGGPGANWYILHASMPYSLPCAI